jgi:DNA (cytosine-5)-methyltransferase 1
MELRPDCWKNGKHQGNDTFGRMQADLPACTVRTAAYNPTKGRYIHPFENRGLNTVELAALQTFPPDWVFRCKAGKRVTLVSGGRQIGNAVPPLLGQALGRAILKQLTTVENP